MEEDDSIIYGTPSPVFNRKLVKGMGSLSRNNLVHHAKSTSSDIEGSTRSVGSRNSPLFTHSSSPGKSMASSTCMSPKQISAQTKHLPLPGDASFAAERAKAIERKKLQDRISPFKLPKHARSDFVKSSALLRSEESDESDRNLFQSCSNKNKEQHKRKSVCFDEHSRDGKKVKIDGVRVIGWPSSSESSSSDDEIGDHRFRIKRLKKSSNFKMSKNLHNNLNKLTTCNHEKGNHTYKTKQHSGKESRIKGQYTSKNQHILGSSNTDSHIEGNSEPYERHSDICGLRLSPKAQTYTCGASPTFKSNFPSSVLSTGQLSPRGKETDLLPCAADKSPRHVRLPLPKDTDVSTYRSEWNSQSHVTPEKANRGNTVNKARVAHRKTVQKALLNDKTMERIQSPILIDLTSPASDKAVQQIQQLEKDEEIARRLQEELDKEFALALAQQPEGPHRDVSYPVDISLEQPVDPSTHPPYQWVTPPQPSRGHQTRAPRYIGYEENEIQQMLQHLHSELGVVLQGNSPVRRRRRGRGRGFAHVNVMMTPDRAGNDYEELLRLGEMLGDAKKKGLSKGDMNRLPTVSYKKTNSGDPESECHICMCDYEEGDAQKILPCFHSYHSNCIDQWIANNATCPVCRVEINL